MRPPSARVTTHFLVQLWFPRVQQGALSLSGSAAEAAHELWEQLASVQEKLAASRRNEQHLEKALEAAEQREAAAVMQISALEPAVKEHHELATRLQVLQARADDVVAERSRAQRFEQVCQPLPRPELQERSPSLASAKSCMYQPHQSCWQ
jgi:chromosome segregation ATPase